MVTPDQQQLSEWMRLGLAGDNRAYRLFLEASARMLRRYVQRRVAQSEAEDVLQDILLSLHKARRTYDGKRPILPWMIAIARYRIADYLRSRYSRMQHMQVDIADVQDFLQADVTETGSAHEYPFSEAVGLLPERQQKILHLMHYEGFTAKETGEKLGMKESAVKVAAHRAYKMIRSRWVK